MQVAAVLFEELPSAWQRRLFKDNFLTLAPGESRTVEFCGDAGCAELNISSLNQKVTIKS